MVDTLGRPVTWMDARAQVTALTYSQRDEVLVEAYADGTRVTTTYDGVSQPRTIVDATGWYTMTYSGRGEKISDEAPQHIAGGILTHGYDSAGNRILLHSWRGRQTMAFDPINRITAMWDPEQRLTTWVYDARDLMIRQEHWNGTKATVAFDPRGLFSGIRHTKSDGTVFEEPQYVRDAAGAPVRRIDTGGALTTWVYDQARQLRSEWRSDGNIATQVFDPAGNWSVRQVRDIFGTPTLQTWVYDAAAQMATESGPGYFLTFTFDGAGNLRGLVDLDGRRNTYSWDPRSRLTGIEIPAGKSATYTYRFDDLRAVVNVQEDALKQVWDVPGVTGYGDLFEELTSGDARKRTYYRGQRLATQREATDTFAFLLGDLGSTAQLTDASQVGRLSRKYSAWGETYSQLGTATTPLAWNGDWGYYTAVGQSTPIWVRERYLEPQRGRWMSSDPIGFFGGPNLYVYSGNRPVELVDPEGLVLPWVAAGAIGAVFGGGIAGIRAYLRGARGRELAKAIARGALFGGLSALAGLGAGALAFYVLGYGTAGVIGSGVAAGFASGLVEQELSGLICGTEFDPWGLLLSTALGGVGAALPYAKIWLVNRWYARAAEKFANPLRGLRIALGKERYLEEFAGWTGGTPHTRWGYPWDEEFSRVFPRFAAGSRRIYFNLREASPEEVRSLMREMRKNPHVLYTYLKNMTEWEAAHILRNPDWLRKTWWWFGQD